MQKQLYGFEITFLFNNSKKGKKKKKKKNNDNTNKESLFRIIYLFNYFYQIVISIF